MNSQVNNDSWIHYTTCRTRTSRQPVTGLSQVLCAEKILSISNDMHRSTTTREYIRRFVRLIRIDKSALRVDTSRQYWTTLSNTIQIPCFSVMYACLIFSSSVFALHRYWHANWFPFKSCLTIHFFKQIQVVVMFHSVFRKSNPQISKHQDICHQPHMSLTYPCNCR